VAYRRANKIAAAPTGSSTKGDCHHGGVKLWPVRRVNSWGLTTSAAVCSFDVVIVQAMEKE
jgi:hypothetical protein